MMKSAGKLCVLILFFAFAGLANAQSSTREVNGKTYRVHKVVSGETLYKISKHYNTSVKDIQTLNHIGDNVKVGQELLIPGEVKTEVNTQVKNTQSTASGNNTKTHKVAKGETLSKIARQYGITVQEIKAENNLKSESINIGQVLRIPSKSEGNEQTPVVAETVAPDPQPAPKEEKPAQKEEPVAKNEKAEKKVESGSEIRRPAGPRQEQEKTTVKNENGGMPSSAEVVLAETATEKEETAVATVGDYKLDQSRTFVVHPSLPKGSIIVVINESTGKMAYCRVVDNVKVSDLDGAGIGITKAVAEKIGLKDGKGSVKIKYAAP